MPLCISKMGQMPKTLMKTRKMYNRIACFCAFRKWAKCQKRFETNKCKRMLMKTRKNITEPHVSVYFENGPNVKNAHENEKMYNRVACPCAFRKWAKCKNAHENEKNVQPGHMPLCISKMGQMPKTLMKMRKMYNRATCLCAFRKWTECRKRLKSTKLNKKFHNRSTSEGKTKDVVVRQQTSSANCKLCKVSLAYTLTKQQ